MSLDGTRQVTRLQGKGIMMKKLCLVMAVIVGGFGLALLAGALALASPSAMPVSAQGQHCVFDDIEVESTLNISDTLPGSKASREVYFANPGPGVITLTVTITNVNGDGTCHFSGAAAFGQDTYQYYAISGDTPVVVLTYPVRSDDLSQSIVMTSSENITGTMGMQPYQRRVLTFTRDVEPPIANNLNITREAIFEHLYPIGTRLYYTDTVGHIEAFWLNGESVDEGAGLWKTSFSSANLGHGLISPGEQKTQVWSAEYLLRNLPPAGTLTATSYDYLGNSKVATFTYQPDGAPPTSTVKAADKAADGEVYGGGPFDLAASWDDGEGCGVKSIDLYYRVNGGDWLFSTEPPTDTLSFTPPTVSLSLPITYEFFSQAVDHLGNLEAQRDTPDTVVVVRPVHIYLPLVVRNYMPFVNGSFEAGWSGWEVAQAGLPVSLAQTIQEQDGRTPAPIADGAYAVLLGDPSYTCREVPQGYAAVEQTFSVPQNATLTFKYIIWTQDASPSEKYDRFEVYIDGMYIDGTLVYFDGNQVNQGLGCDKWWRVPGAENPRGGATTGWATGQVNLSSYTGNITVSFRNYSRYDSYYNTYTYIDDVRIEPAN